MQLEFISLQPNRNYYHKLVRRFKTQYLEFSYLQYCIGKDMNHLNA